MSRPRHAAADTSSRGAGRLVVAGIVALALVAAGAGVALWVRNEHPGSAAAELANTAATTTTTAPPLTVVATTPAASAAGVDPGVQVSVTLSAAVNPSGPMPTFTPAVAGTWSEETPEVLLFSAAGPLPPGVAETLTVPGGSGGIEGAQGQLLSSTVSVPFTVALPTTERLQQLLAVLGYLPLSFTPAAPSTAQQLADTQTGTFAWRWSTLPTNLTSLWTEGSPNVITKGAVMAFESQHNLTTDGVAGPQVWAALLAAAAANTADPATWDYVLVSEDQPESATVYVNGAVQYQTVANTGVAAAATAQGTFPVFLRYVSTTMTGTNPDGSKYSDPNIPWVSYFNGGDALHGFVRATYGWPQSDGCVEMPPANAAVVYPLTPIGTLVTVA